MVSEVIIPNLGANIENGEIVEWHAKEGDMVYLGDPLFVLETTKGTFDIEAEQDGILLKILSPNGVHKPLTIVGYIGDEGDEISEGME
jgi:pyruvate/2-oxoglutarate dehydrogenase complex dihydrolipoamide acyltransferase (E2) component